jgi:hypothetical protein
VCVRRKEAASLPWKIPNIIDAFVGTFHKFDEMTTYKGDPDGITWQFAVGDADEHGWKQWRPLKFSTPRSALDPLYARLPARFPPLFEHLALSYRWAKVDLQVYRLLANPPGENLDGLSSEISRDPGLWEALLPTGYMQFGQGPDIDYDPVCFDIKSRTQSGDYRVVKIDHEKILCNYRVKVVAELAPSFEELVLQTIRRASEMSP